MSRRVAYIKISKEGLSSFLFSQKYKKFKEWNYDINEKKFNPPKNVKIVGMEYKALTDDFVIVLESEDFPEILDGGILTEIFPVYVTKTRKTIKKEERL